MMWFMGHKRGVGSNVKRQLAELCDSLDEDCSGEVSYQELLDGFQHNKEFKHRMWPCPF
jgi:hypothetical protein